jgi:hypothetical protein
LDENGIRPGDVGSVSVADHAVGGLFGSPTVQQLGNRNLRPSDINQLNIYLTQSARINLYGCNVGNNVEYLKSISDAANGRTVTGPTYEYQWPSYFKQDSATGTVLGPYYNPMVTPSNENGFNSYPTPTP